MSLMTHSVIPYMVLLLRMALFLLLAQSLYDVMLLLW